LSSKVADAVKEGSQLREIDLQTESEGESVETAMSEAGAESEASSLPETEEGLEQSEA
jgi:hypothetical protein